MTYMTAPLAPVGPFAIYPSYIRDAEVTLDVAQLPRSLSGSDFIIKHADTELLRGTGAPLLSGDRKVISDNDGQTLYAIRSTTSFPFVSKTFSVENGDGEVVMTVRQSGMRANFDIAFTDTTTGKPVSLSLKGNVWASQAEVTLSRDDGAEGEVHAEAASAPADATSEPIATIKRHIWSKEDIFLNRQRYALTVAPGVDLSLLVAICMCFDECKNEPRPHSLGL